VTQTPKPSVTSKVPYSGSAGSVGAGDRVTQTQPNSLHALYILRTGFPPIVIQYIWVTTVTTVDTLDFVDLFR